MQKLPPKYRYAAYAAIIVLILVSCVTLYRFFESIYRFVELSIYRFLLIWALSPISMWARSPINWLVTAAALLVLILVIRYILRKMKQL